MKKVFLYVLGFGLLLLVALWWWYQDIQTPNGPATYVSNDAPSTAETADENETASAPVPLSESDESEVLIFAENVKLILATIGYTFLKKPTEYEENREEIYLCKGAGFEGRGIYSSEGMVVLAGSDIRLDFAPSVNDTFRRSHDAVLKSGSVETVDDKKSKLIKDYVFKSPSAAANIILGRHSNGWTEWRRESDGKTLDKIYRQES